MTSTDPRITVLADNIHLGYRVRTVQKSRNPLRFNTRRIIKPVLKGISFAAREGEFIGVIGRNGSGKSTLLRALSGLESVSTGRVYTSAKPQLLGVGAALIPNLSGSENVILGLLAMGYSPEEAEATRESVIDLAQIGPSINQPMNTYSSGMGARLKFAISVAAQPKILMVDEALATGDATFQERSKNAMDKMIEKAGTVFLVNHSRGSIEEMCTRVLWLEDGQIVADGDTKQKMEQYMTFASAIGRGELEYANTFLTAVKDTYAKQNPDLQLTP